MHLHNDAALQAQCRLPVALVGAQASALIDDPLGWAPFTLDDALVA